MALIITIIVLIILAAVTIIEVQDSGLVDRTMKAAEEYAKAQEKENADMESLDERMEKLILDVEDITGGEEGGGRNRRKARLHRRSKDNNERKDDNRI